MNPQGGLDFFLSEMSVSDHHGGGITLQRVLADDLPAIGKFFHVHHFGADYPVIPSLGNRCLDMPFWPESRTARRLLRSRLAPRLAHWPPLRQRHAEQCADTLCRALQGKRDPALGLVCPQGDLSLYTLDRLRRLRPVKYITWIMDDHLVRWQDGEFYYPPSIEELMSSHLAHAEKVFVISPAMAEFYQSRFGITSEVLFSPADCPESVPPPAALSSPLRLAYFGTVGRWQLDALAFLASHLTQVDATLDIYCAHQAVPAVLRQPQVRIMGRLPSTEVQRTMSDYHAVVLPISFRPELRPLSEFNIATKMSEYLASGTATLVIGPAYAAMSRFLHREAAVFSVDELHPSALYPVFTQLRNPEAFLACAANSRRLVDTQLSTAVMRRRWRTAFKEFTSPPSGSALAS